MRLPSLFGSLVLLLLVAGCAPTIIPPASIQNPVLVAVADNGRHTSLILPAANRGLIEFAWGDYPWFAANHNSSGDGFNALFFSKGSTLGVRWYSEASMESDLLALTQAKRVMKFNADATKTFALRDQLTAQFESGAKGGKTYNDVSHMYFVHDDAEHYWLGHNCNHVTARWLREMGCEVHGMVLESNFKVKP